MAFVLVATFDKAAIMANTIIAMMRPYSTAVAPFSDAISLRHL